MADPDTNLTRTVSAVSAGCWRWLASHGDAFDDNDGKPAPTASRRLTVSDYKILGEIALMLMIRGRAGAMTHAEEHERVVAGFCAAVDRLRLPVEDALSCLRFSLSIILAFEANGRDTTRFRAVVDTLLRQDLLHLVDQTPWGIRGLTYFLDLCRVPHDLPATDDLYNWSSLRARPPLHRLSTHDKYAISHLFFFLGDFGLGDNFFAAQPDYVALCDYLDELTASCLVEEDWDLLGEFLVGYACLGAGRTAISEAGWTALAARQRPEGQIEAPRRVQNTFDDAGRSRPDDFRLHYHQTLVAIIASTLTLRPDG